MSQVFNPYRDWLGVASASQSPSYYELLGIRPLEGDLGTINAAYQRQAVRLAAYLNGGQADLAQRLMSELAEARMTLMTPTAKRAYDQALAARGLEASGSTGRQGGASGTNDIEGMLPPAASPQTAQPVAPAPSPVYQPALAQPYPGQVYAGGAYAAGQAYGAAPGQSPVPVQPAYPMATSYYAPRPVATAELGPVAPQSAEPMPVVRRRVARRRSSPVPALLGAVIAIAGVLAGIWLYQQKNETVAVSPTDGPGRPADSTTGSPRADESVQRDNDPPSPGSPQNGSGRPRTVAAGGTPGSDMGNPTSGGSDVGTPGGMDGDRMSSPPAESEKPTADKPSADSSRPESDKPTPDRPQPDKPESDKPIPEAKPREAGPEEAAAVAKSLNDVRAALANRELSSAKDLLDEATIEATAPDSRTRVHRVEILTSYVEMFWDAVRKTLPKLEAAETIEIDGSMIAVVEADEEHLVVRIEGRNREYTWKKLPAKIAYYLANRWLAPDDPVRNLVLAAFEIVEPKGDLTRAQSLLDAAAAARLDAEPLYEALKTARGG
jgi:hypothetical protein